MIEPYVTEKQCRACGECKPLTCFSPAPKQFRKWRGPVSREPLRFAL